MKFFFHVCLWIVSLIPFVEATTRYQLVNLGLLDHLSSEVTSINNQSHICGTYKDQGKSYIFSWDSAQKLNYTKTRTTVKPLINNSTEIFGSQLLPATDGLWEFDQESIFCWKNPSSFFTLFNFVNLGFPKDASKISPFEQERSVLWDVNDLGQMVIMNHDSIKELLAYDTPWTFKYRLWVYDKGKYQPIHQTHLSVGLKINNQSQVLGYFCEGKDLFDKYENIRTSIYDLKEESIRILDFPGHTFGKDLNDQGQVVGIFYNPTLHGFQGFLEDPSGDRLIFENFSPSALNNHNQIIGKFLEGEKKDKPAIWDKGCLYDVLEVVDLVDDKAYLWDSLDELVDINDQGAIIGQGKFKGNSHGFLLRPVD